MGGATGRRLARVLGWRIGLSGDESVPRRWRSCLTRMTTPRGWRSLQDGAEREHGNALASEHWAELLRSIFRSARRPARARA